MPRGRESDYKPLYIIRASYSGETIPGKYNGDWGAAYVSYDGYEQTVSNFEVTRKKFFNENNNKNLSR